MQRLRAASGMSLRALARAAHVDPGHLSRIEAGSRPPSSEVAAAVDAALGADGKLAMLAPAPDPLDAAVRDSERLATLLCVSNGSDTYGALAEHLAVAYLSGSAVAMLDETSAVRRKAVDVLRRTRRPGPAADLTRAIGQMSGVLAYAALDLGHPDAALAHTDAAWAAGEAIGDSELLAWVRGTQSLIARFQQRYVAALRYAEDGLRYASPRGTGRARLLCGIGQSAANLGDRAEAHKGLNAAADAREQVQTDGSGLFGFSLAKQHYYSGSSLIWLDQEEDAREALAESKRAINLWITGDPVERSLDDEALAHTYAATASVQLGEVELAAAWLEPILGLPEDRRISWIMKRMERVAEMLGEKRFAGDPLASEIAERIREYA